MIFPKELRMMDISLGLTAMAAVPENDHGELNRIRSALESYTHETIYGAAVEIASEYGIELVAVEMDREDFRANWSPAFAYGHDDEGNIVCGLCTDDRQFLMPPIYSRDCIIPHTLTVIRARSIVRH